MRVCPALRLTLRLARQSRAAAASTRAMAAPQEPRLVVTAFVTSAADGAQSRILLLRRSSAVRCAR
jgi:hypothetical protein